MEFQSARTELGVSLRADRLDFSMLEDTAQIPVPHLTGLQRIDALGWL